MLIDQTPTAGRFLVSAFLALVTVIALINAIAMHRSGSIRIPIWVFYGVSLAVLLPTAFASLPVDVAARFAVTLAMVCFFCDLIVGLFTELQTRLTELAVRDPLTGAFNRRQMISLLEQAVEELGRNRNPSSLACFDVDHFKKVNDRLGHEAGDRVLRNTSLVIGITFAEALRGRNRVHPPLPAAAS